MATSISLIRIYLYAVFTQIYYNNIIIYYIFLDALDDSSIQVIFSQRFILINFEADMSELLDSLE